MSDRNQKLLRDRIKFCRNVSAKFFTTKFHQICFRMQLEYCSEVSQIRTKFVSFGKMVLFREKFEFLKNRQKVAISLYNASEIVLLEESFVHQNSGFLQKSGNFEIWRKSFFRTKALLPSKRHL